MENVIANLMDNEHIIKGLKEDLTGTIHAIYTIALKVLTEDVIKAIEERNKEVEKFYNIGGSYKNNNVSLVDLIISLEVMKDYVGPKILTFKKSLLKMNIDLVQVIKDNKLLDNDKQNELGVLLNTVSESIFDYLNRMEKRYSIYLPDYMQVEEVKDVLALDKESNDTIAWLNVWNKLLTSYSNCLTDDLDRLKNLISSLLTMLNDVPSRQE